MFEREQKKVRTFLDSKYGNRAINMTFIKIL